MQGTNPSVNSPHLKEVPPSPHVSSGMDRRIEKSSWPRIRLVVGALVVLGVVGSALYLARNAGLRTFSVPVNALTIDSVRVGTFEDFIPVRGTVTPLRVVYLDAVEGGRVEEIFVQQGTLVAKGDPILQLSNAALQLDVISREAQVTEQLNNLRNSRLALEQNRLSLKSELLDIDYQLTRLERLTNRRQELFEQGLLAQHDFEETADELAYYRARKQVTLETQEQEESLRLAQIDSLASGVEQLERNLEIARRNLESLLVTAPIDGQLTSLNAEIGESMGRGERLGQIDDVDNFKVTAMVDEYYVTRLQPGQDAATTIAGHTYELTVSQVYPEVRNGQFEVDLAFVGLPPTNIRRGQTLQLTIALGDPSEALLLRRGGFFQSTGGNWAFVLDDSGSFADRRPLRIGRGNPDYLEVLEGLETGDKVITSNYAEFADMDRIRLER